ncbi:MAG TPA: beta-ketoacyl-[acyl-carrier-protein] synthase family protein [Cyclobacteriaceae bacterium]|jgi:3-oxoacyl-[acyl-carrier-protein] synthase-1|nr:beta-ketoacyl-[acyl-carrier-protein] synthase family protein [Cyclobacteriaceae bacterium]
MSRRVFVTGYGIITSIGTGAEKNYESLINRHCGYGAIELLDTVHQTDIPACEIKLHDHELCKLADVPDGSGYTRTALLGVIALREAMAMANLSTNEIKQAGLLSATTTGGIRELEKYYYQLQDSSQQGNFRVFSDSANPGEHTERMAELFGIKGYIGTISTACSSSANTIMMGADLIKNGVLNTAICGGTEALSKFTINGFNTLMILDKEQCRPFDKSRTGLNLGEGAAYLVLESEESILASGKKPIAEVKGYGNTNDAFHQTASSPDGGGAYQAMLHALVMGGVTSSQIDYVNAHGTATENNDLSEGLAMQKLFDAKVPHFSSTKPYTGHTLAAAGAIEAVFCMLAMQHDIIYPSINFKYQMDELTISPQQELIKNIKLNYILSNSFGFGGNASSLLFSSVTK